MKRNFNRAKRYLDERFSPEELEKIRAQADEEFVRGDFGLKDRPRLIAEMEDAEARIRLDEKRKQIADEIEDLFDDLIQANEDYHARIDEAAAAGLPGVPLEDFVDMTAKPLAIIERMRSLCVEAGMPKAALLDWDEGMRKLGWDELRQEHKEAVEMLAEYRHQERVARRRAPDETAPPAVKCKACGRKQARLEGFCKKCARENGIVVHGKIT